MQLSTERPVNPNQAIFGKICLVFLESTSVFVGGGGSSLIHATGETVPVKTGSSLFFKKKTDRGRLMDRCSIK